MPRLRKGGKSRRRPVPERKTLNFSTLENSCEENENESELIETEPGKYEVAKRSKKQNEETPGCLEPVVIPKNIAPIDYLTQVQAAILGRIERLAMSGTTKDTVKLKANLALLNKILPDLTKNEVTFKESPYERIARIVNGDGDEK